jgi:hypothetical protein
MKQTPLSSPGLTGRPSIPETPAIESRGRGVLDRPVKPGDDSFVVAGVLLNPSFFPGAKRRSNPVSLFRSMDCFAEPVIGRRFAPTRWLALTTLQPKSAGCLNSEQFATNRSCK